MRITVLLCVAVLSALSEGTDRVYYIASVEEEWDYAPSGVNLITYDHKKPLDYFTHNARRIGSRYVKALYREFKDDSFTARKERDEYTGVLGPTMVGEVGDRIVIHYKNLASRPFSMHPHGVNYKKDSEGAFYQDKTTGKNKLDDGVLPNSTHTYIWSIRESEAPSTGDPDCLAWIYHSHVDTPRDTNSGLIGSLMTCRKGTYYNNSDYKYKDRTLLFKIFNENESWYIDHNIKKFCNADLKSLKSDKAFFKSNRMHSINGYMYGNLPGLSVCRGDKVGWNMFTLGTEADLHTAYIHGQTLLYNNHRTDVMALYPGKVTRSFMQAKETGRWLIECDLLGHYFGGMLAYVDINDCPSQDNSKINIDAETHLFEKDVNLNDDKMDGDGEDIYLKHHPESHDGEHMHRGHVEPHIHMEDLKGSDDINMHKHHHGNMLNTGNTREYFIAAEEVTWDYAPSGRNKFNGTSLNTTKSSLKYFLRDGKFIGGKYKKVLYKEYTDSTFTNKVQRSDKEAHLGFLGPIIRAEVGDTIKLTFLNKASRNYSVNARGVSFSKMYEGALYKDGARGKGGDQVQPGHTFTYIWTVTEDEAPSKEDPQCLTWIYHSAVDQRKDIYSGLVGPLLTCKRGSLDNHGKQIGVDSEFILLFSVTNENIGWYLDDNVKRFTNPGIAKDKNFKAANQMHSINGYSYGNLPLLRTCLDDVVSWHIIGLGSQADLHAVHFSGHTFQRWHNTKDSVLELAGTFSTIIMYPDNLGIWSVACRSNDHFLAGESAMFEVSKCSLEDAPNSEGDGHMVGATKTYFIAAEEEIWDYAPINKDVVTGKPLDEMDSSKARFVVRSNTTIGSKYLKAVFVEYSDDSFMHRKERSELERHLGILGPVIKAEVGDKINVVFKNNAKQRSYSIHPHGVMFDKSSEGIAYKDGETPHCDEAVAPGRTYTYHWSVPARSGPGHSDPNCIVWAYYSAVDIVRDTNSGLIGPIVICRKNVLNKQDGRLDMDREFGLLFTIFDENLSWYIDDNIEKLNNDEGAVIQKSDASFRLSNMMYAINGYVFQSDIGLEMREGEHVAWYLIGMGGKVDIHTVHFHGQTVIHRTHHSHRADVVDIFPGIYENVEMSPNEIGTWLLHCHVNKHMQSGMETVYTVLPNLESSDNEVFLLQHGPSLVILGFLGFVILLTGALLIWHFRKWRLPKEHTEKNIEEDPTPLVYAL
ncbi:unnamed protein product [Owenia fusiformis]|uniref:Uncharacterized protein n=1 Tax=Owenia fusiformis TaxID=6347 RepID=A0A8J1XYL2_OWEFU|nr:unnamed protein product [Owenia fusiformis]